MKQAEKRNGEDWLRSICATLSEDLAYYEKMLRLVTHSSSRNRSLEQPSHRQSHRDALLDGTSRSVPRKRKRSSQRDGRFGLR